LSNLRITVWNVEHGTSIYAVAPNGKKIFLDCGSSSDFSPSLAVNSEYGKKKLDYLVISHPHRDHITDLENLDEKFQIKILERNTTITEDVMRKDNPDVFDPPNDEIIGRYFDLAKRFTKDVTPENDPSNPSWGNECTFHTFRNRDASLGVNNLSVITFVQYGGQTILYGGDMEEKGWLEMLKKSDFTDKLRETTVLIASHHGNDSGYCGELFDHFTPKITIFSAGKYVDDNALAKYESQTSGIKVRNKHGEEKLRRVLTTRKDGHIDMVCTLGNLSPKITLRSM